MPWENSTRAGRLPHNWKQIRQTVIARAEGQCEAILSTGTRCTEPGRDVDHIQRGDNHDLTNLQLLCTWHHTRKTGREAANARRSKPNPARHPDETHPGLR